jgi:aspartate/methionine/tyrosine aminotransferase
MRFAQRTDQLRAEGAYQVLARAQQLEAQGRDIIHLEIGQPDFETYPHIRQAGIEAIRAGKTRYTPPAGMPELRQAIAADAGQRRGIEIQPEQVVVTPGAKPNLFFPILALIEAGDEVIYPDPGFPSYSAIISTAGGVPVPVPLREEKGFSFDLQVFDERRAIAPLIILNQSTWQMLPPDLEHITHAGTIAG